MTFVVDASVTLAWCFEDERDPAADWVFDHLQVEDAVAPTIWPLEVANSLLAAERRGRISSSRATQLVRFVRQLPISVDSADARSSMSEIVDLARAQGLSAYDASYAHLALRVGLPLATLDARLRLACEDLGVPLVST